MREYTVEVTGLSPSATEQDVGDFFAFCGEILRIEIERYDEYGESACTALVTFRDAHALETAVLLSGAMIDDQRVFVTRWGHYEDEFDIWNRRSWRHYNETGSSSSYPSERDHSMSNTGEAVEVVKSMLGKGYVLGKDALSKAKAFDETHQVRTKAAEKIAEMGERTGLSDTVFAGLEAVRSVDERYHVSGIAKTAFSVASTAFSTSRSLVKGAFWLSDALNRAAKAASDYSGQGH